VPLVGYGVHRLEPLGLTVLAARPHTIGGPRLGFRRWLIERYGVGTLGDSAARLSALFDEIAEGEPVVVLAHCGPTGLGAGRADIFGRDFHRDEGDFGDPDLRAALDHARATNKTVLAVVAGHMHHGLRGGGKRRWLVEQDGLVVVNAARVPRHRAGKAHHVRLTLDGGSVAVDEAWLELG
jgi:uncharacterized protein (TIGR04168 family)